jgi:hypothetical protein
MSNKEPTGSGKVYIYIPLIEGSAKSKRWFWPLAGVLKNQRTNPKPLVLWLFFHENHQFFGFFWKSRTMGSFDSETWKQRFWDSEKFPNKLEPELFIDFSIFENQEADFLKNSKNHRTLVLSSCLFPYPWIWITLGEIIMRSCKYSHLIPHKWVFSLWIFHGGLVTLFLSPKYLSFSFCHETTFSLKCLHSKLDHILIPYQTLLLRHFSPKHTVVFKIIAKRCSTFKLLFLDK